MPHSRYYQKHLWEKRIDAGIINEQIDGFAA